MGKGPEKVKETSYQKELAKTAANEWNRYQDVFVPVEDNYISQARSMGDESNYETVSGDVNKSFNSSYSKAGEDARKTLYSSGVNPASGKAVSVQNDLAEDQLARESQATSAGQHNATERYTGNLQNVVAMGKGQQTKSIGSLQDIASASGREASQAAFNRANEISYPAAAVGLGASAMAANPKWTKNAFSTVKGGLSNLVGGNSMEANNVDPTNRMA